MQIALTIVQIVITVALIITVLMQSGKSQGLSGSIAGGAETFFGKNKGRTIDGILSKVTSVLAVLFVISSIALSIVMMK
jgi:preprotein translocase subunit SecG